MSHEVIVINIKVIQSITDFAGTADHGSVKQNLADIFRTAAPDGTIGRDPSQIAVVVIKGDRIFEQRAQRRTGSGIDISLQRLKMAKKAWIPGSPL